MKPWVLVDTAAIPGSDEVLRLLRRGSDFSIRLGRNELMSSRLSGSEKALAGLACERVGGRPGARLLVGGLGMGFTLAAALAGLRPDARVVVAELVPAVVSWARGPLAGICGPGPDDPRVTILEDDVAGVIRRGPLAYDAILLDVDNGPDGLTRPANDRLYDAAGLAAAMAALRPGGVLAVWSAHPDRAFTARLNQVGFSVEEVGVRANGRRGGARHTIWLATASNGGAGRLTAPPASR